ncbi:MAG: alpha/beta fold hydrolase [Chloroflexi bacterium]|nr:alpha/beta fold hydrolase [Chloroflexota bacterium]
MSDTPPRSKRQRWIWRIKVFLLLLVSVLLALFYLAYPLYTAFLHTHPGHNLPDDSPADWDLPYEDVRLTTADGLELAAWYIPPQNGAVIILLHGLGANRGYALSHATYLAEAGYGSLLVSVRAHGASDGDRYPLGRQAAVEDVLAALDFVQAQPDVEHIGGLGFSLGGILLLQAAAQDERLEAVIADGPGGSTLDDLWLGTVWDYLMLPGYLVYLGGTRALDGDDSEVVPVQSNLHQIAPRPVFLVAGGNDWAEVRGVERYYESVGAPKRYWEVPDAGHIGGYSRHPDEYARRVLDFLDTAFFPAE